MQRNCGTDISVPSRFACLKIEDDEFRPVVNKNSKKKNDKKPTNANTNKKPNKQVSDWIIVKRLYFMSVTLLLRWLMDNKRKSQRQNRRTSSGRNGRKKMMNWSMIIINKICNVQYFNLSWNLSRKKETLRLYKLLKSHRSRRKRVRPCL